MKRVKILIASVLFCAMSYAGFTAYEKTMVSEAEKFITANIEALTTPEGDNDGWTYCRCHDDQQCYVGNAISFRASCVRLYGNASDSDCNRYQNNCPPFGV